MAHRKTDRWRAEAFPPRPPAFCGMRITSSAKKHVLSAVENYDHTCFYVTDHPDAATLRQQIDLTMQVGMARVKPHREYMSSDVSLVILASLFIHAKTQFGRIAAGGADWGPWARAILGILLMVLAVLLVIEGVQTIFFKNKKKAAK